MKSFILYWRHGKKEHIQGASIAEAVHWITPVPSPFGLLSSAPANVISKVKFEGIIFSGTGGK